MLAIQTNKNRQFNTLIMFTGQQNKNCKYRHHSTELKHLIVTLTPLRGVTLTPLSKLRGNFDTPVKVTPKPKFQYNHTNTGNSAVNHSLYSARSRYQPNKYKKM